MKVSTNNKRPLTQPIVFVGLDVHKNSIALAASIGGKHEWLAERNFGTDNLDKLLKFLRKLEKKYGSIRCCYEASGAGYVLYRSLRSWGFSCAVIAPSLIPTKAGDRRKTDKLDARKLCSYLEAGLLTEVNVPDEEREAVRGLVRCRQAMREDVTRAKHQVSKFLQTKGLVFREGKKHWTQLHFSWLNRLRFNCLADTETFGFLLSTLAYRMRRLEELDKKISSFAEQEPYREIVRVLCGYRGVRVLTAMVLITEIGDVRRFGSPTQLMSYVGLTPSIAESGESKCKSGKITKAGSARCRHVLVQAAWNAERRPTRSYDLRKRQEELPAWVVEHSWRAQQRLHKRFRHLEKTIGRPKAAVAVARELIGFLGYALMRQANGGQELE